MEKKAVKEKQYFYCGSYEAYYTKGLRRFERTRQGFCSKSNKVVDGSEKCDCWKTKTRKYNCVRKRAVSRALYEILIDLSAIRQIIQENQEEENYNGN